MFVLIGIIGLIVPFVSAYWVYNDADKRGKDNTALWALAVG